LVGGTPLVELRSLSPKPGIRIFGKLEGQNPSGSVKDRLALGLVRSAEARGDLSPGMTIVEASSGNTGIALAMVGKQRGYTVQVVIPHGVAPSIGDVLALYGAEVEWCDSAAGLQGAIDRAEALAEERDWYPLRQFRDPANVEVHYATTGEELVHDLPSVDVFVAGVGTAGTVMGVARRLREHNPDVKIVAVEPRMGDKLQGLRSMEDGGPPPLLDLEMLDARYLVDNAAAIRMTAQVVNKEGLLIGVSGGACLHAALRYADRMDTGDIIAMVSDSGWKYLPARPWEAAQKGDDRLDDLHWW
jgi:cysteine synthase B